MNKTILVRELLVVLSDNASVYSQIQRKYIDGNPRKLLKTLSNDELDSIVDDIYIYQSGPIVQIVVETKKE